jgi:bacteriocin biosynthesis cyclodehydratase domain-containing protein
MDRIRVSQRQWTIPLADGFLLGRRASVLKRVRGGEDLKELLAALLELLGGGPQSSDRLCAALQGRFQPELLRDAIQQFMMLGILEPDAAQEGDGAAAHDGMQGALYRFFAEHSDAPHACLDRLRRSRVAVVGGGRLAALTVEALCESAVGQASVVERIETGETGDGARWLDGADLLLACADDPVERLRVFPALNEIYLKGDRPWLSAYADGDRVFLGPLLVPGETGCHRCLELREESQLPQRAEFLTFKQHLGNGWRALAGDAAPPTLRCAGGAVAMEAIRILSRLHFPVTYQTLVAIDLRSFETEYHALLRVPFCDACGPHLSRPFRKVWNV